MNLILCALLLALPWWEGGGTPWGLFVAHSLILVAAGAMAVRAGRDGIVTMRCGWLGLGVIGLLGACLISFAAVSYKYGSFLALWSVLMAALLAAVAGGIAPAWRAAANWIVIALSSAQAALVLLRPAPANMTASGSFANANHLAAYLNIGIFLALAAAVGGWRQTGRRRAVALAAGFVAALDIAALLRIGARGALLALVLVAAGWGAARIPRGRTGARRLLWAGVALLLIVAALAVAGRFQRVGDPYRYERIRIWQAGLEAARDAPVVGIGPGMFERRSWRWNFPLEDQPFRFSKEPRTTESMWVEALAETGLLGLAATVLLLGALAPRLWRLVAPPAPVEEAGPALAAAACLVQSTVDTPLHAPAVALTLIVLLGFDLRSGWSGERLLNIRMSRAMLLAATCVAWLGAVLLPWRAHSDYLRALSSPTREAGQALIERSIRQDPANPLYHAVRAEMAAGNDRPLDLTALYTADRELQVARRIDPGSPDLLHQLARLHTRSCLEIRADEASLARATALYRELVGLGIKDPRPRVELATFLMAQGRDAEAVPLIEESLQLEPRFLGAWLTLAAAQAQLERPGAAAEALEGFERARGDLSGHQPRNGYEQDLMRFDAQQLEGVRRLVGDAAKQPA